MNKPNDNRAGVSGMALYLPKPRVALEDWCAWTGNDWGKIRAVVGTGFRCPDANEDVYTMAAGAALQLILRYELDPARIGCLALGTESSKDNSAGAVIVRGLLDRALRQLDMPALARDCEVPEMKHACLGGIYALKNAVRYVRAEGRDRQAIVIAADIAEYERGSSGEQTQGAGAVAMLVEARARLFEVDLDHSGSASQYRGPDFRKPFRRYLMRQTAGSEPATLHDYPVFSGRYSTYSYLDETLWAFRAMARRTDMPAGRVLDDAQAVFFHRPYHHMPVQGLAFLWLDGLVNDGDDATLSELCETAGVSREAVAREMQADHDLYADLVKQDEPRNLYPAATAAAAALRKTDWFRAYVEARMGLGSEIARECGNLYSASLPAWLAAGLEQARDENRALAGATLLAIGYGSGDAAEVIPLQVVPGWEQAAGLMHIGEALAGAVDLTREQYEQLHDGLQQQPLAAPAANAFVIGGVGTTYTADFQDLGIDYYEFTMEPAALWEEQCPPSQSGSRAASAAPR